MEEPTARKLRFVALQVVAILYARHRALSGRSAATPVAARDGYGSGDTDNEHGEALVCSQCGAHNDPGFQFCRDCVADLRGRSVVNGPGEQSDGVLP
jgi:ribosomal protein L40E